MAITSFSPTSGGVGDEIQIYGSGFTGTTSVNFGGIESSSFGVVDDGHIIAFLGAGASGIVYVDTPGGLLTKVGFTFTTTGAVIDTFTPTSATPGQKVSINGSGFTGVTAVKFGGVDAIFFKIVSDNLIEAYPNLTGTNTITVTNDDGDVSKDGFTLLLTRVKLTDLPQLARAIVAGDLMYVWDGIRNILCQSNINQLPAGGGTGGGGGSPGNIYTAVGSPFKVRDGDETYEYIPDPDDPDNVPGTVVVTDVRLLGKVDYVVSATDAGEFDNDRLTFDADAGSVTISSYQLTSGRHITIFADGILTTAYTDFLATQQDQMTKLMKVAAPFLPSLDSDGVLQNPGGLVAWFRPAIEIPDGWAEWTPGCGCNLRGQDTSDTAYDGTTNPDSANRANGLKGGSKTPATLTDSNIPEHSHKMFSGAIQAGNLSPDADGTKSVAWSSNHTSGNQDYDMKGASDDNPSLGHTSKFGEASPEPIKDRLDPFRIVNFIFSTQNA